MMTLVDEGKYREVATLAIAPAIEFCLPYERPQGAGAEDVITAQFSEDGSFVNAMLEDADYVATSIWLQLRLWAFLDYGVGYDDRFVLLTVLFLCDTLGKRLDPKQPRFVDPVVNQ